MPSSPASRWWPTTGRRSRIRTLRSTGRLGILVSLVLCASGMATAGAAPAAGPLTWSQLSPPTSPPALSGAAAAFDRANATVVVFGGRLGNGAVSGATWVWDGSTWSQPQLLGASPVARQSASMAFDTALVPPQLILFGGRGPDGELLDDTWAWNGSSWNEVATSASPGPRAAAALTTDGAGHLVLFGGYGTSGSSPTAASEPVAATAPTTAEPGTAGSGTAGSGSAGSGTAGSGPGPPGSGTSVSTVPGSPAARGDGSTTSTTRAGMPSAAASRDARSATAASAGRPATTSRRAAARGFTPASTAAGFARQATVAPEVLDDTWVLMQRAGADEWRPIGAQPHPPPTTDATLATDAEGRTVLFGGTSRPPGDAQTSGATAQTWRWNGRSWSHADPRTAPPARLDAILAYDADTNRTVLFGGLGRGGTLGDTWLWDGRSWQRADPVSPPTPRASAAAAYDASSRQLLAFGGETGDMGTSATTEVLSTHAPTRVPPAAPPTSAAAVGTTVSGGASRGTVRTSSTVAPGGGAGTKTSGAPPQGGSPTTSSRPAAITVYRGDPVTLTGSGFLAGAPIVITFHSAPTTVGRTRADAAGDFKATVEVPTQAGPGGHHFEAVGPGPAGRTELVTPVRVLAVPLHPGAPAASGPTLVGIAVAIPLLAWVATGVAGRRRRGVTG